MLTFLFWNIHKNPIAEIIKNLVNRHQVDVLMLAECTIDPGKLLKFLNTENQEVGFHLPFSECKSVFIFTRFSRKYLKPIYESRRYSIRKLKLPAREEILLTVAHLQSKLHSSNESQGYEIVPFSRTIRRIEKEVGHTKTLLVGDFNMNPFEAGIVAAEGLNAVNSQKIASQGFRTVQGYKYKFFYNPMWGQFADSSESPPGNYYYNSVEQVNYYWNIFDQVLIRPELLKYFPNNELKILTTDGKTSFLSSQEIPLLKEVSDHLPILFKLSL